MPAQKQYCSKIVWGSNVTTAEQDEVKALLGQNGFGFIEMDGGLCVTRAGALMTLPPDLNDQIACLPHVLGVFDRPLGEGVDDASVGPKLMK